MNIIELMPSALDMGLLANIKASADLIEQASEFVVYFGFRNPRAGVSEFGGLDKGFSILKIETTGTEYPIITTFFWANGTKNYDLSWLQRANYEYLIKTF